MRPNPQFPADLVSFTEEIRNEKLHFLCSDTLFFSKRFFFNWGIVSSHGNKIHFWRYFLGVNETSFFKMIITNNFKWQQRDSNPQPLNSKTNTQPFSQTGEMIGLCCQYLSVRCIWLYIIIMSRRSFRVNLHSVVCLNVKELLSWSRCHIWDLNDSNEIRTHNHLVRKRTLNHLANLAKWLGCVLSTYLYGAFDCTSFRVNPHSISSN